MTSNDTQQKLCILCDTPLPESPVIHLKNVPVRIQNFMREDQLDQDKGADLIAYQCSGCGHIQLLSQPVVYVQGVTSTTTYSQGMLTYRRGQVKDFIQQYGLTGKNILDVGCGDGHLLQVLKEEGVQAVGIDASEKALDIAREHGHEVHLGYITRDFVVPGAPFDGFVCYDVIEHVPDIKDFLQGVYASMKVGAIGILETPSFEKVLETLRFYDFMPDHLSYFTVQTLKVAFELSGFDVLHIERNRDEENLTVIAQKRAMTPFEPLRDHMKSLQGMLEIFISSHTKQGKKVAIWGASLQTLMLSSIISLKDIHYVIDSADYKQGTYTPVSHLPIVSPAQLEKDPVDVIIVNAPRYQAEIVDQIQNKYQFPGVVAVLEGASIRVIQEGR